VTATYWASANDAPPIGMLDLESLDDVGRT
jgi:hypothetical protein